MESPPGSPLLDEDDIVPCKGCGNVRLDAASQHWCLGVDKGVGVGT
jgi:hypothetical protein